ncbi:MAG: leucine-rich repeat protein, partial [Pseudomonas sp.]|nr:leucine-rich repeat protein [Pseudomonas sp.]
KAGYPSGSLYPIIAVTRNNNLFYNNLNEVTFNSVDSLSSIGKGTFALCKELLRVRIVTDSNSLSLTSIGNHAFYNCEKLSTVVLDPNEEYITGDCKIPTTVKW